MGGIAFRERRVRDVVLAEQRLLQVRTGFEVVQAVAGREHRHRMMVSVLSGRCGIVAAGGRRRRIRGGTSLSGGSAHGERSGDSVTASLLVVDVDVRAQAVLVLEHLAAHGAAGRIVFVAVADAHVLQQVRLVRYDLLAEWTRAPSESGICENLQKKSHQIK